MKKDLIITIGVTLCVLTFLFAPIKSYERIVKKDITSNYLFRGVLIEKGVKKFVGMHLCNLYWLSPEKAKDTVLYKITAPFGLKWLGYDYKYDIIK